MVFQSCALARSCLRLLFVCLLFYGKAGEIAAKMGVPEERMRYIKTADVREALVDLVVCRGDVILPTRNPATCFIYQSSMDRLSSPSILTPFRSLG